jgi:drug/metabolite transporter (DMT)-like permease
MIWLILSILSATGIYVTFKFVDKTKTPLINPIVINYLIAAIAGFWLYGSFPLKAIISSEWIYIGLIQGVLLIVLFFIVGKSSRTAGISITTVSAKMAVVIPMVFAIIVFNENAGILKIVCIFLALSSVVLSVYKKQKTKSGSGFWAVFLPVILFFGMGAENSILIYAKEKFITDSISSLFSATLFAVALIAGLIITVVQPKVFKGFLSFKTWILGTILGLFNYGSIYFMLRALNSGLFANSVTYGVVNVGIVSITVLIGTVFFKEKLTKLNIAGVVLSVVTFILLTLVDI